MLQSFLYSVFILYIVLALFVKEVDYSRNWGCVMNMQSSSIVYAEAYFRV